MSEALSPGGDSAALSRIGRELEEARLLRVSREHTDCRTPEGRFVGLLDAILSICRFLPSGDPADHPAVREALSDMGHDEDFRRLQRLIRSEKQRRPHPLRY